MFIFPLNPKPKIFISYRRADNEAPNKVVRQLYHSLANKFGKDNVLIDDDIPPGKDYRGVLKELLSSCNVMLVIIGPNWQIARLQGHEDWVRIEIETGLQRHIRVIPVMIDGATFDASLLPNTLSELNYRQRFELSTKNFDRDVEQLIEHIESNKNNKKALALFVIILIILFSYILLANRLGGDPIPFSTPTYIDTHTPTDTLTSTPENTIIPELTQQITATNPIPTSAEITILTPSSGQQIEIMIQPGWLRIRTLSNEPISLEGLILLPLNNLSRSGEPVRDFSVLTGGRLAQPNTCYIYTQSTNVSVDYLGCEKSYDIISLFWLDYNNQPVTIEIYWNDTLKELCNRICEV